MRARDPGPPITAGLGSRLFSAKDVPPPPSASASAKLGKKLGANPSLVLVPKLQGCVTHPLCASFSSYLKWGPEALLCRASGMRVRGIGGGWNLLHLKLFERVV